MLLRYVRFMTYFLIQWPDPHMRGLLAYVASRDTNSPVCDRDTSTHTLSLVSEGNARKDVTLKLKRPSAVYRVRSLLLKR